MTDQSNDIISRLSAGTEQARKEFQTNPALCTGQKPAIAVVGCSDSRVPTDVLFDAKPGDVFTLRNIGGSLEDENNPNELSADAKKFITYAHHIGVQTLVIIPHGKCGCIANACNCAAGNAHGHGLEGSIIKDMGDKKGFAVSLVPAGEGNAYLAAHGLPQNTNCDEAQHQAVELAHALHQVKLAQNLLTKLESKMTVALVYFDVAACETYVSLNGDGNYQAITNTPCACSCSCSCCG